MARISAKNSRVNGQTRYSFKSSEGRTSNEVEAKIVEALEEDGWEVLKNGWPDLLAVKDGKVRFFEVKPHGLRKLSPRQQKMADVLKEVFGVEVEVVHEPIQG